MPTPVVVSCGGGTDPVTSVYFCVYFDSHQIAIGDLPPWFATGLICPPLTSSALTDTAGIAGWTFGSPAHPSPSNGTWNAFTTYSIGQTVDSGGTTYRSLQNGNLAHPPQVDGIEMMNGWWTNECQPTFTAGVSLPKRGYGYLLKSPWPSTPSTTWPVDISALSWDAEFWTTIAPWNVLPARDIVNLYDVLVRVNYASGKVIDLRPLDLQYTPGVSSGANDLIRIPGSAAQFGCAPGVTAQFQTGACSPLGTPPQLVATGWQQIPTDVDTVSVGDVYSSTITASGGTGPYTYRLADGGFPPGISIDEATGVISGTIEDGGIYSFTIEAKDSLGATGSTTCGILADCGCSSAESNNRNAVFY